MRVTKAGNLRGNFPFVCMENPTHIANAVAEKKYRSILAEANTRRWG